MKTYPFFLASSYELQPEREKFEIFIRRQIDRYLKKKVHLKLELWEDMGSELNDGIKQDDYNKILEKAEIVVVLFWTKMGKYTREEFALAYQIFKETGKPMVFVYQKTMEPANTPQDWEITSKKDFLDMLLTIGKEQFHSTFQHHGGLLYHFQQTLFDLFDKGTLKVGEPIKILSLNAPHSPSFVIGRDKELEHMSDKLSRKGSIFLISGEGGTGKTTLAAKYWHENKYTYRYGVYLFYERGILNAMIDDGLGLELQRMDEDQKIRQIQRQLNSLGDDVLLLMDNANDAENINKFLQVFSACKDIVFITCQCREVWATSVPEIILRHLYPKDAKSLFFQYYYAKNPEFDEILDNLLKLIQYQTLLVEEVFSENLWRVSARRTALKFLSIKFESEGNLMERIAKTRFETCYASRIYKYEAKHNKIFEALCDFTDFDEVERH